MTLYILLKYWKKHVKSALAMLFAGVLLAAIVFIGLAAVRENRASSFHVLFNNDVYGHAEIIAADSNDEIFQKVTEGKSGYNYCVINVYGKFENGFSYGTIEDEQNVWHIPLTEGRMPETADEIAADRGALNKLFWAGKCGDTITIDGKTYTVTGIIDEYYGTHREGAELNDKCVVAWSNLPQTIPLIFVGKCDGEPLYRVDMFNGLIDPNIGEEAYENELEKYNGILRELKNDGKIGWFLTISEWGRATNQTREPEAAFFLWIAFIGAIISALSVFSILRSIFSERKSRIEILKRIGMSKRRIAMMYAVECAVFAFIQITLGIIFGFSAYEGIFKLRTEVIGEKVYSGLTDMWLVTHFTPNPFLFSAIISATVIIIAYILCILTDKIQRKAPDKNAEPRPLSKCFKQIFSQKSVSATQIAALTLICFSVISGYLYYTDNGKYSIDLVSYFRPSSNYYINGLNMEEDNIAEYYSSAAPTVNYIGEKEPLFPFVVDNFSAGIDDNTANTLPEYTFSFGSLPQTLISSEKRKFRYINEIDTASESFRQGLLALSDEEHQNFFDEGQLGSEYLYKTETRLTTSKVIESLSGNVTEGELNIEKLNSGEEIIVAYQTIRPPFEIGETISLNSISAGATGYGVGEISSAEVKISALVKINPEEDKVINSVVRNKEDYNLLTTATGAENMGFPCAKYTGIYALEPMDGGLIPSSAQMKMKSLAMMQHDYLVNQLINYSSSIAILLVMSLLGFAAYFNGIGMKIRQKKYEISVLRAVGTNLKELKKKLLLESMKIPLISTIAAYVLVKLFQLMNWLCWLIEVWFAHTYYINNTAPPPDYIDAIFDVFMDIANNVFFEEGLMWQANAEIPMLILFAVICAVTFLLTIIALRKFKNNIAGDLNEGRTRQ